MVGQEGEMPCKDAVLLRIINMLFRKGTPVEPAVTVPNKSRKKHFNCVHSFGTWNMLPM